MPQKLHAGSAFPKLSWPTVGGGQLDLERESGWRALIVYRGRHCPLCKRYLNQLNELLEEFREAGIFVAAISSDPEERAQASSSEGGWSFPVGLLIE
jgi:peroxiredoxin